jgi:PAS domain S-box-containing protein
VGWPIVNMRQPGAPGGGDVEGSAVRPAVGAPRDGTELEAPGMCAQPGGPATGAEDARRAVLELAVQAAGIGTFDWDLVSGDLVFDSSLLELFGYDEAGFDRTINAFNDRVHPADLERVEQLYGHAIENCGDYEAEYRIVRPDGTTLWVAARGRAICDETGAPVRLIGVAYDATMREEGEARVARVMDSLGTAFFSLDRSWRFSYVNSEAERVLGRRREELLGGDIWGLFPAAVGSAFEANYRHAVASGEEVAFEAYYPEPLNAW